VIDDKSHKSEGAKSVKFKAVVPKEEGEEDAVGIAWVRLNLLQEGQQEAFVQAAFP
jgi:hypothetical protein